ncbi:ABC transporter permease [Vibrio aquimaris]|uniref:FtsX-like permease family protein n=1 Tax=Vibrio aquimaris TaxID=2587862 RepID=A0A5P9CIH7_9VIBR|nr:ABC transporter permease [Vibrio aquimaris]QFT26070.1 FtsX-like permease family protein [Vibrio aquimaris]
MLWPVVKALLGHYRRYPFQIILVWLGLTLGVSLLVGVTSINDHAKSSYQHGEKLFSNPLPYRIRPKHITNKIPQGFYVQLRRDGFDQCAPFDRLRLNLSDGSELILVGLDPLAMWQSHQSQDLKDFPSLPLMATPHPVMVGSDLAAYMDWQDGDQMTLSSGSTLGPIIVDKLGLIHGTQVISDMSLTRMIERKAGISFIACGEMNVEKLTHLKNYLPNGMIITRSSHTEIESITRAFHINLSAMGMLAFLVGLFIFYQAMSLSLTQRQPLVGILRQTGVSGSQLTVALGIELLLLIFFSWLCGNLLGIVLANQLIPAVSGSLRDLYDANVELAVSWSWSSAIYSLAMSMIGAFLTCAWPTVRLLRTQPVSLTTRLSLARFSGTEFSLQAAFACVLCIVAIAIYQAPQTQVSGLVIIALMLVSVALFTPYFIWKLFDSLSYVLKWPKARWFFSDAAVSMSYRGVATMAFMLAMAANIGVETMVGSFRDTTDRWLSQRLGADLYIYPSVNSVTRMTGWLSEQPEVESVWWRWEQQIDLVDEKIQAVSTGHSDGEWDSLTVKIGVPNYWYHLHHSKGVMISESMAIKRGIRPGDYIDLFGQLGKRWQVLGVYYDYGNPYNQIMLSHQNWLKAFKDSGSVTLGVILQDGVNISGLKHRLESVFRVGAERTYDNSHIHKKAMKVFDRTFSIADTLGNITLVIAICGIFFASLAGEVSRQRHISLLRCLGITGKELVLMGSLQLFLFGAISVFIALPLGLALANLIVDIVMKPSLGWTLSLQLLSGEYFQTSIMAMCSLMLAGALPTMRMIRHTPMKFVRNSL